jgi:quercetin dioxygenase-like cupin family protein
MTPTPVIRAKEEGERLWFYGGGDFRVKATAEETGGSLFIFEDYMTQGKMTPLHLHPDEEEAIYLIEGELLVQVDGANHRVTSGGLCVVPRGVPHAFLVISDTARALVATSPGKTEAFFRGASEPVAALNGAAGTVDFAKLQQSAAHNGGIEILGPPPFDMSSDAVSAATGA